MNVTSPGANKDAVGAKTKDNSVRDTLAHLMLRNLSEVFGERDSERRMAAIKNLYSEDAVFFEAEQRLRGATQSATPLQRFRPLFPPSSNSRRWLPLPAITTSGDCSGDSVLQALRPSSTGWTLRSSKMAASTRFTSSSTTRTIRGRGRKAAHAQSATAFHCAWQACGRPRRHREEQVHELRFETCRLYSKNGGARVKGSRNSTFCGKPAVAVGCPLGG